MLLNIGSSASNMKIAIYNFPQQDFPLTLLPDISPTFGQFSDISDIWQVSNSLFQIFEKTSHSVHRLATSTNALHSNMTFYSLQ